MQSQINVKTSNAAGWRALVVGFLLGNCIFAVFDLNGDDAFTADDADSGSGAHDSGLITGSTIAPVALISSTDGKVTYALTAALSGQTSVIAIQGSTLNLGRQSWRELQ